MLLKIKKNTFDKEKVLNSVAHSLKPSVPGLNFRVRIVEQNRQNEMFFSFIILEYYVGPKNCRMFFEIWRFYNLTLQVTLPKFSVIKNPGLN